MTQSSKTPTSTLEVMKKTLGEEKGETTLLLHFFFERRHDESCACTVRHVVGAVSSPGQKRKEHCGCAVTGEVGSGLGNLHGGLAEEARSPGPCTSIRAVGCSLGGSAQTLQLKVERSVLLPRISVLLRHRVCLNGKSFSNVSSSSRDLLSTRHWRH